LYFRRQDYPNKELLILDDSATAPDVEVPESGNIVFVHLRRRLILGEKRNLCCELARGEIIAHWDDDDWFAPTRLSVQVAPLLHEGAHMSVLYMRHMLVLDRREVRAAPSPLFFDSHLMFWKVLWREKAKYGRTTCGESGAFYSAAQKYAKIAHVMDEAQAIYVRHDSNTWTNQFWRRTWRTRFRKRKPVEEVIPSEDLPFYLRLMSVQKQDAGACSATRSVSQIPRGMVPEPISAET
jgi:glycosyltransferase involved in cell wall biosynthesis